MSLTFHDFLSDSRAAQAHRAVKKTEVPDLSHVDFEKLANDILRQAVEDWRSSVGKATMTAIDEREKLVSKYIHEFPAETRANAVSEIYRTHEGLYERCRREETVDTHGRTLREIYDRVEVVGKSAGESVEAEVERRLGAILAKEARLTRAQAMQFLFKNDPALYARWRREAYADQM